MNIKSYFLWGVGIFVILSVGGYIATRFMVALYSVFEDWQSRRDDEQLRAESESRREMLRKQNEERLDTGCDHFFDDAYGAFPPDVCCRCGLEQQKPLGGCDHQWQKIDGPLPGSHCVKCGKLHGGAKSSGPSP
ncbi:MAG: hypothetical protein QGG36_08750 [Pirellulaceae bacterium]|jgi:hypothetical protein|nr:hypothetical protein [Pirellulaceae bacterium]MDP7015875.1 hypothetical protein [Pirellulaceae bacterium]